jgi:signal transduction histidine kinase
MSTIVKPQSGGFQKQEVAMGRDLSAGEQSGFDDLSIVGDAMSGLIHEFNNSLNTMMLEASVLGMHADAETSEKVALIRKVGAEVAHKLALFQRFRESCKNDKSAVCLNRIVEDAVRAVGGQIQMAALDASIPQLVNRVALARLICLLIHVVRDSAPGECIQIRTKCTDREATLVLEPIASDAGEFTSFELVDDARLHEPGGMTPKEIEIWTAPIQNANTNTVAARPPV